MGSGGFYRPDSMNDEQNSLGNVPVQKQGVYCYNCGAFNESDNMYCTKCGTMIKIFENSDAGKDDNDSSQIDKVDDNRDIRKERKKKAKPKNDFFAVKPGHIVILCLLAALVIAGYIMNRYTEKKQEEEKNAQIDEILDAYEDEKYDEALELITQFNTGQEYVPLIEGAQAFARDDFVTACAKLENLDIEDAEDMYEIASEHNAILQKIYSFDYEGAYKLVEDSKILSDEEKRGYRRRIYFETSAFTLIYEFCETYGLKASNRNMEDICWVVEDTYMDDGLYIYGDDANEAVLFEYTPKSDSGSETLGVINHLNGSYKYYGNEVDEEYESLYDEYETTINNARFLNIAQEFLSSYTISDAMASLGGVGKEYTYVQSGQTMGRVENLSTYNDMVDSGEIEPIHSVVGTYE